MLIASISYAPGVKVIVFQTEPLLYLNLLFAADGGVETIFYMELYASNLIRAIS